LPPPGSRRDRNGISLLNRRFTNCLLVYNHEDVRGVLLRRSHRQKASRNLQWRLPKIKKSAPSVLVRPGPVCLFFCLSEERRNENNRDRTGCLLCQRSVKNTSWMTRCSCSTQSGLHRWVVKRKGNGNRNRGDTNPCTRGHEIPQRLQIGLSRQTSSNRFVFHW